MHINSINDAVNAGQLLKQAREQARERACEQTNGEVEPQTPPEIEVGAPDDSEAQGETGSARGVIRLLESGHFKGVADVRLRINFFDELSARANASAVPVAQEGAGPLVDSVNGQVDELLGQLELDEETGNTVAGLRDEFDTAVQAAVEDATTDGRVDTTALADSLNTAFAAFSQQLHDLLAPLVEPPAPEEPDIVPETPDGMEPVEEPVEGATEGEEPVAGLSEEPEEGTVEPLAEEPDEETPETPAFDLSAAIATLNDAFGEALVGFLASIEEAAQLPPLTSEPSGNGVAYERFLAIYNELIGQASAETEGIEEPEEGGEDIDLTV